MALDTNFVAEIIPLIEGMASAEKMQLSNAIMERVEEYKDFDTSPLHTVMTGIRNGNLIPILSSNYNPEAFPFNDSNNCDVPVCDLGDMPVGSHKWKTGLIECKVGICMRSFNDDFRKFWNDNVNDFGGEADIQSALVQYLVNQFRGSFNLAKWRTSYFGDEAFAGASAQYYNGFNGFFVHAEALAPTNVVEITQNAGATYTDQKNITGLDIYNYLVAMVDIYADQVWNEGGQLEFRMTKLTAQKLMNYFNRLQDKTCCGNLEILNPAGVQGSKLATIDNMSFDGYPIRVVNEWDYLINEASGLNGGGGNNARLNPHRILFTYANNLVVGTESTESLDHFDVWYNRDDKKIYLEGGARLGAGIPLNNYVLAI